MVAIIQETVAEISTFTRESFLVIRMSLEDFRIAIDKESDKAQEA